MLKEFFGQLLKVTYWQTAGGQTVPTVLLVDTDGNPATLGGGSTADKELLVSTYRCKTAFTGATVGDTITATRVLDLSVTPAVQSGATLWYNEATAAALSSAPNAANLELTGATALTAAQLAAAGLALDTTVQATNTALGTTADAAWGGTGSASVISALKAIWTRLTSGWTGSTATAVTINTSFNVCAGLYVGTAGDVAATVGGTTVVFKGVQAGSIIPVRATNVPTAGTTAADIVALYY